MVTFKLGITKNEASLTILFSLLNYYDDYSCVPILN